VAEWTTSKPSDSSDEKRGREAPLLSFIRDFRDTNWRYLVPSVPRLAI
jgi:hypothetical protein